MKVLCLTPALSMRSFRQMKALNSKGHDITLLYLGTGGSVEKLEHDDFWKRKEALRTVRYPLYQYFTTLGPAHYRKVIEREMRSNEHDLMVSYSMPDALAVAATRFCDIPTVYDVRDMVSAFEKDIQLSNYLPRWSLGFPPLRWIGLRTVYRRLISLEREASLMSDARVYVSDHTMELARTRYNIPEENSIIFYNYAMNADIKPQMRKLSAEDDEPHIVYEGVLSTYGYRGRLRALFEGIARRGVHIHIYGIGDPATLDTFKAPQKGNKRYHFEGALPHGELMSVLTRYDAGLIPFMPYGADEGYMDTMLPNKLFDYLAAGLGILVPPTSSMSAFVRRTRTGHIYKAPDDLPSLDALRAVKVERSEFTIERHIGELERLYGGLCGCD